MKAWIIGRKSDKSVVEVSLKRPQFTLQELEFAIPNNYGGVAGDYSYFESTDEDVVRFRDGWERDLVWSGNEITDIDWSPEENKVWIKMYSDEVEIKNDGVDSVNLRLEVWKADLSGIATNINTTADVPIKTPDGNRWAKATVVNGVFEKSFKTTKPGEWVFPGLGKRFTSTSGQKARIFNQVVLQVSEVGIFD